MFKIYTHISIFLLLVSSAFALAGVPRILNNRLLVVNNQYTIQFSEPVRYISAFAGYVGMGFLDGRPPIFNKNYERDTFGSLQGKAASDTFRLYTAADAKWPNSKIFVDFYTNGAVSVSTNEPLSANSLYRDPNGVVVHRVFLERNDNTRPNLVSSTPADQGTYSGDLTTLIFNENVYIKTGATPVIALLDEKNVSVHQFKTSDLTISGQKLSFNLPSALKLGKYVLKVPANLLADIGGNFYGAYDLRFTKITELQSQKSAIEDHIKAQVHVAEQQNMQFVHQINSRLRFLQKNKPADQNLKNKSGRHVGFKSNFQIEFLNPDLNQAFQYVLASGAFNQLVNLNMNKFFGQSQDSQWQHWASGKVVVGKTSDSDTDIRVKNFIYGMDKTSDTKTLGFAYGYNKHTQKTSRLDHQLKSQSLTVYGAYNIKNQQQKPSKQFIDWVVGASRMNYDLKRMNGGISYTGQRNGQMRFASLGYRLELKENRYHISPYLRYHLALGSLNAYDEKNGSQTVRYDQQKIQSSFLSAGLTIDFQSDMDFKPYVSFEWTNDKRSHDDAKYSMNGESAVFDFKTDQSSVSFWQTDIGFAYHKDGRSLNLAYQHGRSDDVKSNGVEFSFQWDF